MIRPIYYLSLYSLTVTSVVMIFYFVNQGAGFTSTFFDEGGVIEITTAIFFFLASLIATLAFIKFKVNVRFVFMLSMAFATMRELDWHKAWTSDSVLKSKFYISEQVPIYEKIIGAVVIMILIYLAVSLLFHLKRWVLKLYDGHLLSWSVFFALGTMVAAKILDSLTRLLPFTAKLKQDNEILFLGIEETMEMVSASLFIFTALILLRVKHNN